MIEGKTVMISICPYCEKTTNIEKVKKDEEYNIRGELISVPVEYLICSVCHGEFDEPLSKQDPIAVVYKEYRHRKNMIEDILEEFENE